MMDPDWEGIDMAPVCEDCGSRAPVVGLGCPPDWLCLECLNAAFIRLRDTITRAIMARRN